VHEKEDLERVGIHKQICVANIIKKEKIPSTFVDIHLKKLSDLS
jgi:hypothetical protein